MRSVTKIFFVYCFTMNMMRMTIDDNDIRQWISKNPAVADGLDMTPLFWETHY